MIYHDFIGSRMVRLPPPDPAACYISSAYQGTTLEGGGHVAGSGFGGRITDTQLAYEVARAAFRGNLIKIGVNTGPIGEGNVLLYRPGNVGNRVARKIQYVDKYDYSTNYNYAHYTSEEQMKADILAVIRSATFRVIAFADAEADRVYSQLYPWDIQYTTAVSERLTNIPTSSILACRIGTHARQGAYW